MRQHSIKTTYLIHKTFVEDTELMKLIPEAHVYLLVAEADTDYPYAIIRRDGISSERGNKDFVGDKVQFTVKVYSDKYDESVNIADAMRFSIENHILEDELIRLQNINIVSSTEAWVSDSYEQSMTFSAEVVKPINKNQ